MSKHIFYLVCLFIMGSLSFSCAGGGTRTLTRFHPYRILNPKLDFGYNSNIYNITFLFINNLPMPQPSQINTI